MPNETKTAAPVTYSATPRPHYTPWGHADDADEIAPGWWTVSTSSHGGHILSNERHSAIPHELRAKTFMQQGLRGIFEEDEDWCLPVLQFQDEYRAYMKRKGYDDAKADEHIAYAVNAKAYMLYRKGE